MTPCINFASAWQTAGVILDKSSPQTKRSIMRHQAEDAADDDSGISAFDPALFARSASNGAVDGAAAARVTAAAHAFCGLYEHADPDLVPAALAEDFLEVGIITHCVHNVLTSVLGANCPGPCPACAGCSRVCLVVPSACTGESARRLAAGRFKLAWLQTTLIQ